ncbi:MAG: Hsp70 family protein [Anaerolineae bacterium]|nr:Hsp70 family protein [Anaerolineae bacterium]
MKLALDFGTTNSLVALRESDGQTRILPLDMLTDPDMQTIPSLVYIHEDGRATVGHEALSLDSDERLFRDFKRGILATPPPQPRPLDGKLWHARDIGTHFLKTVITALPKQIDMLAMSVPVTAFQEYVEWLYAIFDDIPPEKVRIVDESTAAALGYAIKSPGATVMVFDFGGGTLDLSLVKLPEHRENTGGFLGRLLHGGSENASARVIAKAGRILGGSDIDHWLAEKLSNEYGFSNDGQLLQVCERAKIALSDEQQAIIQFGGQTITLTRQDLRALLEEHGFFTAIRRVIDKVMHTARQNGIFKEDIHHVLLVGGMSLMPAVQDVLKEYYGEERVHADKPFTAVAEGALLLTEGGGLNDYLIHSYGLRYLDEGTHQYDEFLPMGTMIPLDKPVEVVLRAAHDNQQALEIIISEIDPERAETIEVIQENGETIFVAQGDDISISITPLNAETPLQIPLDPPGHPDIDRVRAEFTVDANRRLRVTLTDLQKRRTLVKDAVLATIR